MPLRGLVLTAMMLLLVSTMQDAAGQPSPDPTIPDKVSKQIVADLSRADLDGLAASAGKYITASTAERLKNSFASIKNLGQSQYYEQIYAREYGQMEKDIIYKINFDKAFTFVRLVWHVDSGKWHLVSLTYKTESDLPLPKGWEHIYPK